MEDTIMDSEVTENEPVDIFAEEGDEGTQNEPEQPEEQTPEQTPEVDLDELYKAQMNDTDATLDKPLLIKINGKVTEINNINDMKDLMERGLGATKSFQQIAKHKKVAAASPPNTVWIRQQLSAHRTSQEIMKSNSKIKTCSLLCKKQHIG